MVVALVIRNREISQEDLETIRDLIRREGERGRTHLSRVLCRLWNWRQSNGAFREIACREALRRLAAKGLIELPDQLHPARRPGYRNRVRWVRVEDSPVRESLRTVQGDLRVKLVRGSAAEQLFKSLIHDHHYLGYRQPTGPCLKYLLVWRERPLACLSFGPAAWRVASRDRFVGWSWAQQQARRSRVVNNDRFLILPWIVVPHLASWLLARVVRRLRSDWQAVYQESIALAETFVEVGRFAGTAYAAANWHCVGQTTGRGRNDRHTRRALPVKSVWVYPLIRDVHRELAGGLPA